MKNKHLIPWTAVIYLFAFFAASLLQAAPRLHSASLMQGSSIPRIPDSTAYLHWSIHNPDPAGATVLLQLEPDTGSSGAIYSCRIKLGPKAKLEGRSMVSIGNAERYIVSLIHQNLRVDKTDILLRQSQRNRLNIAVLTDAEELSGYSEIAKNENLYRRLQFSLIRHRNIPSHFSGFAIYDLLIVQMPALNRYNASQKQAVLDYARQGGALVISGAGTPFVLQGTELEELLPFHPVAKRIYEGLNGIRRSFDLAPASPPLRDSNGDLLEPVPQEVVEVLTPDLSTVLLRQDGRPLICRGQTGLGTILGLCFDPFALCKADPELLLPVWNTLIRYSNHLPQQMLPDATGRLNETLQHLQGYVIPPVRTILRIFLFYIVSAVLILGIFFHLKRPALGWCLLCLFGLGYTLFIFRKAQKIAIDQPERSFTAVSTGIWDGNFSTVRGTGNLFAKSDCRPTVRANAVQTFFLPPPISSEHEGGTAIAPSPLHITGDPLKNSLEKISLQQYRPRTLSWLGSSENHGLDQAVLPQLSLLETGFQLEPWKIPEPLIPVQRAILVLPGGVLPLNLLDNTVSGGHRRADGMEADLVFLSACQYIKALRLANPALCLISARKTPECTQLEIENGSEVFSGYDYHLEFIPLIVKRPDSAFAIAPEFITADIPPKSVLRQYFQNGEFTEITIQEGFSQPMQLDFNVHPVFHGVPTSEIRIELDISNPSAKATFELRLLDLRNRPVEPFRRQGNTFFFRPGTPVLDPLQNKIRTVLQPSSKPGNGNGISQRVNAWKILACRVEIQTGNRETEAPVPAAE